MTRFALIGGFLGAGKTTLIGQIAQRYVASGKTVGIITNDQAEDLVDTQNLRSQGFAVGEVAGACFCCSFDDLVSTADSLSKSSPPDLLIAEPVGSCTDLVATVILPLQQLLGEKFELAPFGVLLKPSHGERILASVGGDQNGGEQNEDSADRKRSGFSPQAEYIFRKQLEEADYLMIGRHDQLSDEQRGELVARLADVAPGVPVVAVSPKTGFGVDDVIGHIESPMVAGQRLLSIDYDIYADGEAELGWVNLTATGNSNSAVDIDGIARDTVHAISQAITSGGVGAIAHVKASVLGGQTHAVASVVSNETDVDVGLQAGRSVSGDFQVIVNARVAMDPNHLQAHCEQGVSDVLARHQVDIGTIKARSLRPGRPVPTHRVTETSDGS